MAADEHVGLRLRHRWSDGTTHLVFDPLELLERLAVITPRPRINLILYHGIFAPRAACRRQIVGPSIVSASGVNDLHVSTSSAGGQDHAGGRDLGRSDPPVRSWASLRRRVYGFDVLSCPRCGQPMRLSALIERAHVIRRILGHLGYRPKCPNRPRRGPHPPDLLKGGAPALRQAWTADHHRGCCGSGPGQPILTGRPGPSPRQGS